MARKRQNGALFDLTPKWAAVIIVIQRPPLRTPYNKQIFKVGTAVRTGCEPKHKVEKQGKQNAYDKSCIDTVYLTLSQRHMDLHALSYPLHYCKQLFQASSKFVQGFGSTGGINVTIPITLAIGFDSSLYCRTTVIWVEHKVNYILNTRNES